MTLARRGPDTKTPICDRSFKEYAFILTVSQISVFVPSGAAWATRECCSESGHQSPSHRCNRVRNVAFRPQRRILWARNLRVRQLAGPTWWHDLLRRSEERRVGKECRSGWSAE